MINKKGTVNREQGTGRNDRFLVKSEKKTVGPASPSICRKALVVGVGRGSKPLPSCKAVALTALRMSYAPQRGVHPQDASKHCSLFPFPCSLYLLLDARFVNLVNAAL